MANLFPVISPIDGSVWHSEPATAPANVEAAVARCVRQQRDWARRALPDRIAILDRFASILEARQDAYGLELTHQMGRPLSQTPGEIRGAVDRARQMAQIAPAALADIEPDPQSGFRRFIRREALGVVLVLAPWNYPYLTAVNAIIPALMAGNGVVLKHSDQTPRVATHFLECLREAGLPQGVFEVVHIDHDTVARLIGDSRIDHVCFTGSVEGGKAVSRAVAKRADRAEFIGLGLELGGKDAAYLRADADVTQAVESLVDGAFFNSGQSCCGVERIYVHHTLWDDVIESYRAGIHAYRLGNPLDPATTIGPVVRARSAQAIRAQVDEALQAGASQLVSPSHFDADDGHSVYIAPQALIGVTHDMALMSRETFGPVVGLMPVRDDAHAIEMINDSAYGLTASIWTADIEAALSLGGSIQAGTIFMNRCDYLDPHLAWTGQKSSGRGATLSRVGFEHLTRPKSYHLRTS